ncbi:unnamed protein product [Paramecium sonneborni]|uniref:RBR-type E3 ubiquitin transferase n=1 Tax=Paramecium sonneborni TaxID=65129 RepID=A0A8S1NTX3_9CILI|nr:unnamed protein product [Paramecium sonneborni]
MLEIIEVVNQIKNKLSLKNESDLIIQSFILGVLQGKSKNPNNQDLLEQNLEIIMSLNMLIDINLYNPQRVQKLYNDALQGSKDLNQLSIQLEKEVFEINEYQQENISFIQKVPEQKQSNIQSRLVKSQQNQQQGQQKYQQLDVYYLDSQFLQPQQQQINYDNFQNASMIYNQLRQNKSNDESKSIELAMQLQRQFEKEVDEDKTNQIECQICLENIPFIEMATLYCSHIFHQKCLNQHCTNQIQSRQFPILCPSGCKNNIIYTDLIEVLDDRQLLEFQQLTFKAYVESHGEDYSWCPTPDCQYVFIAGDNSQLNCPVCKKSYCLQCKIEYHNGFSCKEYQDKKKMESNLKKEKFLDDKFFSFIKGSKFKQCPKCKMWVEKSEGCNHMTCRCKFQFCYVCGGVYEKCECVKQAHANWPSPFRRNRR